MTGELVNDLFREALFLAMLMVAVIVIPSLIVGLIISMFQAATQINEQTLSFLPRLLITLATLAVLGHWLGHLMHEFSSTLLLTIPDIIG